MGKINRKQALKLLESLQLFWRGDDIELQTLRLLAKLYVKEKRYGEGFAVMRLLCPECRKPVDKGVAAALEGPS